jgi:hypothetical protein
MEEGRGVYKVLVGKPEGKRPLGRVSHLNHSVTSFLILYLTIQEFKLADIYGRLVNLILQLARIQNGEFSNTVG